MFPRRGVTNVSKLDGETFLTPPTGKHFPRMFPRHLDRAKKCFPVGAKKTFVSPRRGNKCGCFPDEAVGVDSTGKHSPDGETFGPNVSPSGK